MLELAAGVVHAKKNKFAENVLTLRPSKIEKQICDPGPQNQS